jgi:outer membrane biosynthesis protein TonB
MFAIDHIDGGFRPALPDRKQVNRIAACIALSLAAHALLLAVYRQPAPTLSATAPERLTIRLQPAPPPAQAKPAAAPPIPRAQPEKHVKKTRPVIAVEPEKRQSTEETYAVKPAPETQETPAAPATTAPHFDVDAARSMARGMATKLLAEPDPDKVGTALERLPKPSLQTENKFERAIKSAKRPDCKDGVPGGLLAPIFLAMDKKDSGCKW